MWCGIIAIKLIGLYFIDGRLDGQKYRDFPERELPVSFEDLTILKRRTM